MSRDVLITTNRFPWSLGTSNICILSSYEAQILWKRCLNFEGATCIFKKSFFDSHFPPKSLIKVLDFEKHEFFKKRHSENGLTHLQTLTATLLNTQHPKKYFRMQSACQKVSENFLVVEKCARQTQKHVFFEL